MHTTFGPIALLGSGETALAGGRLIEDVAARLPRPLRIAILETPAGFELNSAQVAGRVADFLRMRLQNYQPVVDVVPARKIGTEFSPDDVSILTPLVHANMIFMGPGSPSYAVRHLEGTKAWHILRARHRLGAALVFSSAAVVAIGAHALPVYEIFKVGNDVSCPPGLDLFSDFGLHLSCVPHWNNTEGGADVDTSCCFVGVDRFLQWCELLPAGHTILGLDEHTGIILDFSSGTCTVSGISAVNILRECQPEIFPAGRVFPVSELGSVRCPEFPEDGIPAAVWLMVREAASAGDDKEIPAEVLQIAEKRQLARSGRDWVAADSLRQKLEAMGWSVIDTTDGQKIIRQ